MYQHRVHMSDSQDASWVSCLYYDIDRACYCFCLPWEHHIFTWVTCMKWYYWTIVNEMLLCFVYFQPTTSITLIIGNFTFCLFSADLGQREESLKLYYLLLLDTFFPFKSGILNIAFKSVSDLSNPNQRVTEKVRCDRWFKLIRRG